MLIYTIWTVDRGSTGAARARLMHDYVADQLVLFSMSEVADFAPTGLSSPKNLTFWRPPIQGYILSISCHRKAINVCVPWRLKTRRFFFKLMDDSIVLMNFMGKYFQRAFMLLRHFFHSLISNLSLNARIFLVSRNLSFRLIKMQSARHLKMYSNWQS